MYSRNQCVDRRLSPWLPAARSHCRPTPAAPSPSLNRWLPHPRLAFSEDRLLRVSGKVAGLRDLWGQPLPVIRSGFDDHANFRLAPVEFAIREQTGIGRDDGSTKLKHRSAVEIESENLAVRFTPFWPKLRLPMLIGKTSKHSGNRRPADVSDGAHRAGAVPGRPLA